MFVSVHVLSSANFDGTQELHVEHSQVLDPTHLKHSWASNNNLFNFRLLNVEFGHSHASSSITQKLRYRKSEKPSKCISLKVTGIEDGLVRECIVFFV